MSSARNLLRALVLAGLSITLIAPAATVRAEPSATELTARINKSSIELEKVVESYNALNEDIKTTKTAAAELGVKLGPLEEQVAQRRSEIGALASQAYKQGGLTTADALLNPGGSDSLVARLGTIDHLIRDRERQITNFTTAQRDYLNEKAKLDSTLARQTAQAKELASGKKQIEADLKKLYEMRRAAYGSPTNSGSAYTGPIPAVSGNAGTAVRYAYNAIGKPYVFASAGPNGYDCSGLTSAAWRAAGKSLPHNAKRQWQAVTQISRSALAPGDLVFYSSLGHVALYVGSGKVIHAPRAGESVRLASVDMIKPYGYGRVR